MMKKADFLRASALTALLLSSLGFSDPFWPRLEDLVSRHAYTLALFELDRNPRSFAEKPHVDYLRGYCLRRLGKDPEKTFRSIPPGSSWFVPSRVELSEAFLSAGKKARAAETLALAVSLEPREAWVERVADIYFELGRFDRAAEYYEKLAKKRPSALYSLAWCFTRLGNYPKAMNTWQLALTKSPNHPMSREARFCLADSYLKLNRPLKASEQFRFAREMDRAEFLAAEGLMNEGKYDLALAHYRLCKGRWAEASLYGCAYSLWQQGRLEEARKNFNETIEKFPHGELLAESYYALGRLNETQGLTEASHLAYNRAIDAGQGSVREKSLYRLVVMLFNKGRYEETLNWTRRLEQEFPKSEWLPAALWARGESAFAVSDYAQAIEAYDKLVLSSDNLGFLKNRGEEINYRLGIATLRAGKFAKAADYLARCQGHYAEEALFWRGESTYRLGKSAQALWLDYLKRYPLGSHRAEAQYGLAWGYYKQAMLPEAARNFKSAADGLKDPVLQKDALNRWGSLMAQLGNWSDAKEAFERIEKTDPNDESNRFQKALCSYRLGQLDDAKNLFNAFIKAYPSSKQSLEAKSWMGQIQLKQGRYLEAAKIFEELANSPDLSQEDRFENSFKLAACYQNSGRSQAASEVYAKLMQEPDLSTERQGELKELRAKADLQSGNLHSARSIAQGNATASPWAPDALDEVAKRFYAKKDFLEAAKTLLSIAPRNPEQNLLLARSYASAGDATKSIPILHDLSLKKSPVQKSALFELNRAQQGDGRIKEALISFGRLNSLFPGKETVQAGMDLAQAARDRHDSATAREAYKIIAQGKEKTPAVRASWFALGELAIEAHDYREAAIAFRRAEASSPPRSGLAAQASYWLGYTLVEDKRYEDAITALAHLKPESFNQEELKTWLPLAWLKRGEAYENLRRFGEAKKIYQKVLSQGEGSERQEAQKRLDWIAKNVKMGSKK